MTITTEQIKALREQTGVGILDCRKALEDANGDFEIALENLRAKGLATAAKRADREACLLYTSDAADDQGLVVGGGGGGGG